MPQMDESQLTAILKNEIEDSLNYYDAELAEFRLQATDYYNSEPFGNEQEGKSSVVTSDTAEIIESIQPSLMRIFTQSKNYVKFLARTPQDVAGAEQATDFCNYTLEQNNGFVVVHNWFKSALMYKMGVVKFYWDESEDVVTETYEDLSLDELTLMTADDSVEVVEQDSRPIGEDIEPQMDEAGNILPIPLLYSVKIKRKKTSGKIKVINIPEEEFLIQRRTKSLEDCDFLCHRSEVTVSDLVSMGYDKDEVLEYASSTGDEIDQSREKLNRFEDTDGGSDRHVEMDESRKTVLYSECYIRTDFDGDGIAELRRICVIGNYHILKNEPFDHIPFATLSPILQPHKLIGRSVSEMVMDLQLIKSTVLRQILDNLYLSNNTRLVVSDGVNLDDVLNNQAGGVIRARNIASVQPLSTPLVANQAFPMLDYLDQLKESRTGLSKASMGLSPESLQSATATAVSATVSASQGKIEMIARVFAETGMKDLFKGILHLAKKHQTQPLTVRLTDKFVPVDPRQWTNEFDMSINVGLGTGQTNEKLAMLDKISKTQEQILLTLGQQNPLVNLSQYRETLAKILELTGFKNPNEFFLDPAQQPPMENQNTAQNEVSVDRFKAEEELKIKREKMMADIALAREKLQAELQLKQTELNAELQLRGQAQALGNKAVSQNL